MRQSVTSVLCLIILLVGLTACRSKSDFGSETEQLVDRSRVTMQSMMSDNQFPGFIDLATRAKAMIIVPNMLRAAFFFGGRGGNAVMLVRGADGKWSQPAFYTIGGISWGFQFGGQSSELLIAVMTDRGLRAVMDRQVTLGADAGVAVGELGKGVNAATGLDLKADMYAFARAEGVFAGISVEGSIISPRQSWNQNLYGADATPASILVNHTSSSNSPAVKALVAAMP